MPFIHRQRQQGFTLIEIVAAFAILAIGLALSMSIASGALSQVRRGTDFTEADQLFFDQIRASAENDENIAEAARANNFANFAAYFDRMLDELFIARMEGNEEIFSRVMTDAEFRSAAHQHLAHEIFRRVREQE